MTLYHATYLVSGSTPKEEEVLGLFLQLENTGEQDLTLGVPKQEKKTNCSSTDSDKNQKELFYSGNLSSHGKT